MNKVLRYLVTFFAFIFILLPINAEAKTLGQLKQEYAELEAKLNENTSSLQQTEEEIASTNARITSIYNEIEEAGKEIQELTTEIAKLNDDIKEKDKQTKELMKFFQVSEGVSTYLEYIFEAESITDFIYRVSVTEQLSSYNDKLIDEMTALIKENTENIEKLHDKEDSLKKLRVELKDKLNALAIRKDTLSHDGASLEEEIATSKKVLEFYEENGCGDSDDLSSCANGKLPPDTKFWRPINYGYVTDEYGFRTCPVHGPGEFHAGIDLAGNDRNIYSIANGQVVFAGWNGGYGYSVYIVHNVNGRAYTSMYGHMDAIYASYGQIVTKDTVIGYMGNTGASAGVHVHLNLYEGAYPNGTLVDPRDYINFPTGEGYYPYFADRTSYYN